MSAKEWITEIMKAFITIAVCGTIIAMRFREQEVPPMMMVVCGICIAQYVPEMLNIVRKWMNGKVNGNGKRDE